MSESRERANRAIPNKDSVSWPGPVGIALQGSECREVRENDLNPNHPKPRNPTFSLWSNVDAEWSRTISQTNWTN